MDYFLRANTKIPVFFLDSAAVKIFEYTILSRLLYPALLITPRVGVHGEVRNEKCRNTGIRVAAYLYLARAFSRAPSTLKTLSNKTPSHLSKQRCLAPLALVMLVAGGPLRSM